MFWNAKNGYVLIGDVKMDYVSFGNGKENLIMLPGLGDGLTTVRGMAIPMAWLYREYAKKYKVFIFSRKNELKEDYSTRDMARDQAEAMKMLGIQNANILGISQGGMVAQYLAIDYPDLVTNLVLAVTSSKPNELIQSVVSKWISLAKHKDYKNLMIDTAERSYSESYLKRYRLLYPFLGIMGKPKDFSRFIIQAKSCIYHNAYPELNKIQCPTLVICGACDKIVGANASREIVDAIKLCEEYIYPQLGHAAYEEASNFNQKVLTFL